MSDLYVSCSERVPGSSVSNGDNMKGPRGEAQVTSSWTDEDEDGGTRPSSPSVMFLGRRCS